MRECREISDGAYVTPAGREMVNRTDDGCRRFRPGAQHANAAIAANAAAATHGTARSSHRIDCRTMVRRRRHAEKLGDVIAQLRQIAREIARRRITLIRILRETTLDDPSQLDGKIRNLRFDRGRLVAYDRRECFCGRVARERTLRRGHLVQRQRPARTDRIASPPPFHSPVRGTCRRPCPAPVPARSGRRSPVVNGRGRQPAWRGRSPGSSPHPRE